MDSMFPNLNGACYTIRSVFHIYNTDTLHFSDFYTTMKYGVPSGDN
jgi:hypothetical protein